jgi:hypothetical protein
LILYKEIWSKLQTNPQKTIKNPNKRDKVSL